MTTDNSFLTTFALIRQGDCAHEMGLKMQELVSAIRETGKSGSITITLKARLGVVRGRLNSAVIIEDDITVKLPKAAKEESLFFATESNTLQRNDPNQPELNLKSVDGGQVVEIGQLKRVEA